MPNLGFWGNLGSHNYTAMGQQLAQHTQPELHNKHNTNKPLSMCRDCNQNPLWPCICIILGNTSQLLHKTMTVNTVVLGSQISEAS